MTAQDHVRHFALAIGQYLAAKTVECGLETVVPAGIAGLRQAMTGEARQQLANHRLDGAQQMDLLGAQARTAAALEQAQGNLPRITDIGNEIAVFTAAGAQVIGFVIVTVEEVVRGNVFEMVEALRQTALHRQTKGIEQVARGEVAIEDGVAVLLGNALLVQQLRCLALAL
ncbi:hypothetical protein D3C84_725330 [compost metagenome]